MNITNFYSRINFQQNRKQNTYVSPNYGLQKDTVSFTGGKSAKKLIEEFKKMEPNGNHNINKDELLKVLRYFGYIEGSGSNHKTAEDHQGIKYTYSSDSAADPNFAASVIRGVHYADRFNGALFIFEKTPSDEDIEKCEKLIENNPPHLNPNNKYAKNLYEKKISEGNTPENIQEETDSDKEIQKEINETITRLRTLNSKIENVYEGEVAQTKNAIKSIQEDCNSLNIISLNENLKDLAEKLQQIEENLKQAKIKIADYQKRISNGYSLNDEEKEEIQKFESGDFGLDDLKNIVENIELALLDIIEQKEIIIKEIQGLFKKVNDYTGMGLEKYIEFQEFTAEVDYMPYGNPESLARLKNIKKEIFKNICNMSQLLEVIDYTELECCTLQELKKIKQELENTLITLDPNKPCLKDKIEELITKFNQIKEKDFYFMRDESKEEKQKRTQSRIDKFNERISLWEQQKAQSANEDEQNAPQEEITNPTQQIHTTEKSNAQEEINEIQKADTIITTEKIKPTERKITTPKEKFDNFISKFATKISPLPLASIINATKNITLENFAMEEFLSLNNDKASINEFLINKNREINGKNTMLKLKNASKFAYLNSTLCENTNLTLKQIAQALPQDARTKEVEILFEKYNTPIEALISLENGEDIFDSTLDYILSFAPKNAKNIKEKVYDEFITHGQYLTLLIDENCSDEIKIEILKAFWEKFDNKYSTSYTQNIIENYQKQAQEIKLAQMQQMKLEEIANFDWTL